MAENFNERSPEQPARYTVINNVLITFDVTFDCTSTAMKEAKKKWEEELRAQLAENDREITEIKSPVIEKLEPVVELVTHLGVYLRKITITFKSFSCNRKRSP